MKYLIFLLTICLVSCANLRDTPKTIERLNGQIIYAIPTRNCTRLVYMILPNGDYIRIHRVPTHQQLINIPVYKATRITGYRFTNGYEYYWIQP